MNRGVLTARNFQKFSLQNVSRKLQSSLVPAVSAARFRVNNNHMLTMSQCRAVSTTITIEDAKKMSKDYSTMPNETLVVIAVMGDQQAREERLIREIMSVDELSWEAAQGQFKKIVASNRKGLFLHTLPYKVAIAVSVTAGFCSIPMIFDLDTVMWFNENYVTTDIPEPKDLETPLEVGGWAWNWMEPPLGQISFFLLCMQYARAQMQNLGAKPYTEWFLHNRAQRLCVEYPQYNAHVLMSFSTGDDLTP